MDDDAPRKLGISQDDHVLCVGLAEGLRSAGQRLVPGASWLPVGSRVRTCDVILWGPRSRSDLRRRFPGLANRIVTDGRVWVVLVKQAYASEERPALDREDVIAAGKAAGLIDNKVCRISDAFFGLQFVVPRDRR